MIGLIIILIVIAPGVIIYINKRRRIRNYQLPKNTPHLLTDHVAFYRNLDDAGRSLFENRVKDFLAHVTVTGIGVRVEDLDRILIAAGAVIPIFALPDWKYNNISEILLYRDTFNLDYNIEGPQRNLAGLVGDGPLNRQMILSQPSVRTSFRTPSNGNNTIIHEFAHLIDKADGAADGVPEYLMSKSAIPSWVNKIHETMQDMQNDKITDINLYGATSDAEFFAVITEYFFECPFELKTNHPELHEMLEQMYRTGKPK